MVSGLEDMHIINKLQIKEILFSRSEKLEILYIFILEFHLFQVLGTKVFLKIIRMLATEHYITPKIIIFSISYLNMCTQKCFDTIFLNGP